MSYTLIAAAPDCHRIDWDGIEVVRLRHPFKARAALSILREMGDPHQWRGCFATALRRRLNRLARVVPCSCSSGSRPDPVHGFGACRRPNGNETHLGEPHAPRRDAFDRWLGARDKPHDG